jgi:hypothetical protein
MTVDELFAQVGHHINYKAALKNKLYVSLLSPLKLFSLQYLTHAIYLVQLDK